jgi:transposase-like protein
MTGRPAWIPTDTVCQEVREMASNGLTVAQIADCLGISERTVYDKQNHYPQFLQAIKKVNKLISGNCCQVIRPFSIRLLSL